MGVSTSPVGRVVLRVQTKPAEGVTLVGVLYSTSTLRICEQGMPLPVRS
jgi:hypothetical protein